MAIKFVEIKPPPMTPERQASIDYMVAHWRVVEDGLEWQPCGPECTHEPEKKVIAKLTSVGVFSDDEITWIDE